MFPTTVTIHNVADLQKVMSVLYPVVEITDKSRDVAKEVAAAPVEKPKATKKPTAVETQASPAPTQPTAEVAAVTDAPEKTADASSQPVESAAPAPQASTAADPAVTYKEAAEAVTKLSRTKGRDAAIAVLKSFGADKLPDVKPEDLAAVVAACQAALEV